MHNIKIIYKIYKNILTLFQNSIISLYIKGNKWKRKTTMTFEINFINYFSDEEKEKVSAYVEENFNDLELHDGMNYSVDVSKSVKRTANVDIEVF